MDGVVGAGCVSAGLCYLQCSRSAGWANGKAQTRGTAYSPNRSLVETVSLCGARYCLMVLGFYARLWMSSWLMVLVAQGCTAGRCQAVPSMAALRPGKAQHYRLPTTDTVCGRPCADQRMQMERWRGLRSALGVASSLIQSVKS